MSLRFALPLLALLAASASAQITYDGTVTEPEWYKVDDDAGTLSNGFGDFNQLNAFYADIADDGSSVSLGIAGILEGNDNASFRNYIVVFLDTRAGGYASGNFGRDGGPDFGNGVSEFNLANTFDDGFSADYALQIGCSLGDCFANLYTLSGTAFPEQGGGPNTFLGSASGSADFGANSDGSDPNSRTRGFEIRLSASEDGSGANLELDRQAFQAFAFITSADGFLSNQFITPAVTPDNYGRSVVNFNNEATVPVVYAEQVFADEAEAPFRDKGFRMLGAPARNLNVQWLADQDVVAYTQGGGAGDGPPRFVLTDYDPEAGGSAAPYVAAAGTFTPLLPGTGFLWYLSDGRRGSRPLPWTFEGGGPMASGTITNGHNVNADDFYLVGNPFVSALQLSAVFAPDGFGTIGDAVYVFDPGSNSYTVLSRSAGDVISHMQGAFFEIAEDDGESVVVWSIPQAARAAAGSFVSKTASRATLRLEREEDGVWTRADEVALALGEHRTTGKPIHAPDGSALPVRMTLQSAARGDLGQAGVPAAGSRFALALDAAPGRYRLRLDGALDGLATVLHDRATGETLALDGGPAYTFEGDPSGRFSLDLAPEAGEPAPARIVGDVYPNPATGSAHLLLDVERQHLRVEVLDVLGRLVKVVFEGEIAGPQAVAVDVRALAPGAYVVRVTGGTFVETRRLTVAR